MKSESESAKSPAATFEAGPAEDGPDGGLRGARLQASIIELFVSAADALSVPRSWGEIYGVIFASPQPLSFQEVEERLRLSKGAVSQGLRMLRAWGAVRTVYVPGDRRDHFEPETELRHLIGGFLRERIHPHLEQGKQRLERVQQEALAGDPAMESRDAAILSARLVKLEGWQKKSAMVLPLVAKVLG